MLKVFSDQKYLFPGQKYVSFFNPYWGDLDDVSDVDFGRFLHYNEVGKDFYEIVSLDDAEVIVCPGEWRADNSKIFELYNIALNKKLPFIIFFNNDSDEEIPLEKAIIFRTSFYKSNKKDNEFAYPGWSVDFIKKYSDGILPISNKKRIPIVSYAGYIDYYNLKSMILFKVRKLLSKDKIRSLGPELRGKAVRLVQRDKRFKSDVIIRKGFLGGCKEHLRKEYAINMLKSDYVLVTRGAGNFSYRFYEVLSCGKIPVFIDTDCVLPFEDSINWRDYCVWVDHSEIECLGDKIEMFHQKLSDDGFIQIQKAIRSLYEEKICPSGYYKTLLNQIKLTLH